MLGNISDVHSKYPLGEKSRFKCGMNYKDVRYLVDLIVFLLGSIEGINMVIRIIKSEELYMY